MALITPAKAPGLIRGPVDFKKSFATIVIGEQEEWDRSQSVGASEVFGCHRRAYFAKREPDAAEAPEDEDDIEWGFSERGNEIERKFAVPKLQGMFGEDKCFLMGDNQKTFVKGRLSATPDGVIVDVPPDALQNYGIEKCSPEIAPEIKSIDPRVNLRGQAKPRHVGQNQVQQGILQDCSNYKPTNGIVLYINCSNYKDITPFGTTFDKDIYERAHARADYVFEPNVTPDKFKPEGLLTGDCKTCPFQSRCKEVEMARYPERAIPTENLPPDIQAAMRAKALEVRKIRDEYTALEKVKKAEEAELREMMFDNDTNRAAGEDWSVTLTQMPGKKSLDKEAMVADGLDPAKYMKDGYGYYTMNVKGGKKKKAKG